MMFSDIQNRISLKIAATISLLLTLIIVGFNVNRYLDQKHFLESKLKNKGRQLAEMLSFTYLNTLQLHNWQSVYDAVINLKENDDEIIYIHFTEPTGKISISSDVSFEGKNYAQIETSPDHYNFSKQIITPPSPLIATAHVVLSTDKLKTHLQHSTQQTFFTTLTFTLFSFVLAYLISKKFITARILHDTLMNEHEKQITNALIASASSTLAHSLKNPLGIIRVLSQQLGNEKLSEEVSRMYGTIDQLKHVAPKPVKFSSFKIEYLLDMALKESLAACDPQSRVSITKTYKASPQTTMDIEQLKTALRDLIDNALQAMPTEAAQLNLTLVELNGHAIIDIIDNGSGIGESCKDKLFKPFFTTKKAGTGLGLWGARRVIEEIHHGTLNVVSQANFGTTVSVILPIL